MAFQEQDSDLFVHERAGTRVFRDEEADEELRQCRSDFARSRDHIFETCLVTRGGWKMMVKWRLAKATGHGVGLEDLHFDTAVVRELVDNPRGYPGVALLNSIAGLLWRVGRLRAFLLPD
jgi:hypothetical protein